MADRDMAQGSMTPPAKGPPVVTIDPAQVWVRLQEQAALLAQLDEGMRQHTARANQPNRPWGPKVPKPDSFDGKKDPVAVDQWLYQQGHYLVLLDTPVQDQVHCAAMYLKGPALQWWLQREGQVARAEVPPFLNFDDFVNGVRTQFAPVHARVAARDRLATLTQNTIVTAYIEEFLETVIAIPGMTEEEKIDRFTRGLRGQAHREVRVRECQTLQEVMTLATRLDIVFTERSWPNRTAPRPVRPTAADAPVPMEIGQVREFAGNRYNCGTAGHRASECPHAPACTRAVNYGGVADEEGVAVEPTLGCGDHKSTMSRRTSWSRETTAPSLPRCEG